MRAKSIRVT